MGNVVLTTTPIITGISIQQKEGIHSYQCIIPKKLFGFQAYRMGIIFHQNTKNTLKDENEKISITKENINYFQQAYIRFDNVLMFKPAFIINNEEVNARELNVIGGLMPKFDWSYNFISDEHAEENLR